MTISEKQNFSEIVWNVLNVPEITLTQLATKNSHCELSCVEEGLGFFQQHGLVCAAFWLRPVPVEGKTASFESMVKKCYSSAVFLALNKTGCSFSQRKK